MSHQFFNLPRDGPQHLRSSSSISITSDVAEMHTKPRLRTNTASRLERFIAAIELRLLLTHHSANSFESALQKAIPFSNYRNRSDSQSRADALFLRLISCRSTFNEQGDCGRRRICNERKPFGNIKLQLAIKGNETYSFDVFRHVPATRLHESGRRFLSGLFNFHPSRNHFQMLL